MYKSLSIIGLSLCLISSCKCGNDKQVSDQTNQAVINDTSGKTANVSGNDSAGANTPVTDSAASSNMAANGSSTGNKEENLYRTGSHHARKTSKYPGEFPEGSERLLTDRDVEFLSQWGLRVMMNEIYARHGMRFS